MIQDLSPYIQSFMALTGVILLIVGGAWLVKRYSGLSGFSSKETGELQIRTMKQVDPHTKLVVVSWRDTNYLVTYNAHAIVVLDKQPGGQNAA